MPCRQRRRGKTRTVASCDVILPGDMILPQDTREYDSSDWHLRPLSPTVSGPQHSDDASSTSHVRLSPDATLILGWEIEEAPHYKLYSVTDQWRRRRSDLAARVYQLDINAVYLKVRRHRLRCIKRIASRTVLEVGVPGFRIIVCRLGVDAGVSCLGGGSAEQRPSDSASSEAERGDRTKPRLEGGVEVEETPEAVQEQKLNTDVCHEKRTSYQHEAKRVRQRDRRQAARRARREKPGGAELPASQGGHSDRADDHTTDNPDDPGDPSNFFLLLLLYLAYDQNGQLYEEITPSADRALVLQGIKNTPLKDFLETYLAQLPIDFSSAGQIEEYLAIKESEIIFLKRQQSKMERIEQHYKDQFLASLRELQAKQVSKAEGWRDQQPAVQMAQHQLKVARHVRSALPGIVLKARETYRELKSKVAQVRQEDEEKNRIERLRSKCKVLEKEVHTLATWTTSVVPCSTTYRELEGRWSAAIRNMELSKAEYLESHACGGKPV
ncbi:hypothetical protein F5144DRAFT_559975 [Chaetomium tenue]|uniref:Uncharacterized protein n=1 Tax=Chaetomium tenue TaxID=1854479 RepID=A0ACB7PFB6_9PEZI|nr:hypothetical protein F5144DRAFT_559975 [Chaetomium globosum]